jgi:hypothetical protein
MLPLVGPHPPRADGEQDGQLVSARAKCKGPIQLAWMVNKTRGTAASRIISFTIQTSWMGSWKG